jgi:dGTPase
MQAKKGRNSRIAPTPSTVAPPTVLLQRTRARESHSGYVTFLDNAISDRARVLYSSPFRRLQDRAQVFSLETNAAIRSRLTHSLEVAHIGRTIASRFFDSAHGRKLVPNDDERAALPMIVETACLMHDLGNPPFGHFGETAIKEWFELREDEMKRILGAEDNKKKKSDAFKRMYADFTGFDGNSQTLRIITKIQFNVDKYGLNLTLPQLAAVVKYPWTSYSPAKPAGKKFGVFNTESDVFDNAWKKLNLAPNQRHPLVYLVEAADDISYCMSDIEDAIDKRVASWPEFIRYMRDEISKLTPTQQKSEIAMAIVDLPDDFDSPKHKKIRPYRSTPADAPKDWQSAMLRLRTSVTRYLIDTSLDQLSSIWPDLISGKHKGSSGLLDESATSSGWPLGVLKRFTESRVYYSRNVRQREIIAHRVIHGILDCLFVLLDHRDSHRFQSAVEGKLSDRDGKRLAVAPSVASLLPRKYLAAYNASRESFEQQAYSEIAEWGQRAHLIVDYVSGMTDRFALDTYRLLLGIDTNLEK